MTLDPDAPLTEEALAEHLRELADTTERDADQRSTEHNPADRDAIGRLLAVASYLRRAANELESE